MATYTQIPLSIYDPNNCQLSENFSCQEIVNASTNSISTLRIDQRVINVVQYLRDALGVPISIPSAIRDAIHNVEVGGASNSQHLIDNATALDIKGKGVVNFLATAIKTKNTHYHALIKLGLNGLGLYNDHAHIDTRSGSFAFWDKRKNNIIDFANPSKNKLLVPIALTIATILLGYTLIKSTTKPTY